MSSIGLTGVTFCPIWPILNRNYIFLTRNTLPKEVFWCSSCRCPPTFKPPAGRKLYGPRSRQKSTQLLMTALLDFFKKVLKFVEAPCFSLRVILPHIFFNRSARLSETTMRSKSFLLEIWKFDEFNKREIFCQLGEASRGSKPACKFRQIPNLSRGKKSVFSVWSKSHYKDGCSKSLNGWCRRSSMEPEPFFSSEGRTNLQRAAGCGQHTMF